MKGADILAEIEDVLRTMPARELLYHETPEAFGWLGRAVAAVGRWNNLSGGRARSCVQQMQSMMAGESHQGYLGLMVLLNEARSDLRMITLGPVNTAIGQGLVFDYFDEIRKLVALAGADLYFRVFRESSG